MNRFATFVLGLVAWWATDLWIIGDGRALAYVLFFGSLYAVPAAIYAAIADGCAAIFFPKSPTTAFLILALLGFGCYYALRQSGSETEASKSFNFLFNIGLPTAALVAVYTITNLFRDLSRGRSSGSPPRSTTQG